MATHCSNLDLVDKCDAYVKPGDDAGMPSSPTMLAAD